jgi:ATP-binding cassette, subfamily B, bacterial MsbA
MIGSHRMNRIAAIYRALFADRYGSAFLLRRLLSEHASLHWRSYLATYVLMGVIAGCTALFTFMLGRVVNEMYFEKNFAVIAAACLLAIAVFAVRGAAFYAQAVMLARIANQINADTQKHMFDKLLQHSLAHFDERHSSQYTAQLTYGCMGIAGILNLLICATGRDLLLLISLAAVMVTQDPLLSLIGIVLMPAAILMLRDLIKRVRALASVSYLGGTNVLLMLQDTLQGMRVVKAFGLEAEVRRHVHNGIDHARTAGDQMARMSNRPTPLMEMLGGFAVAAILMYAGYRISNTGATPGAFVAFVTAFLLAYEPAKRLARLNIDLANYLQPARALFEFLDAPPSEPDDSDKPALEVHGGRIEFANVVFAYRPGQPVIRGMSFVAEAGRRTALVGASGGGKSTAFALILRFYEAERGAILIDGVDTAGVARRSVRAQVAYVGQDAFLFSSTIRHNIGCGKANATEDDIVQAAKAAYLHDFISGLPAGYDTPVGENGLALSGGQRQRVAIARALIKNAPVILLDEATAALDSESELEVRKAIAALCRGRTTMVIAHRLHTITQADKILVVENGAVVEEGRHAELLRRSGRYAAFYRLQLEKSESRADGERASAAPEMLAPSADAPRQPPRMAAQP